MNNNEQPNYVLKFNESAWMPKKDKQSKITAIIKKAVLIILAILIFGSLIFGDNLFSELSFTAKALLIALALGTLFYNTNERVPSEMEMRFYDEYLILYREKKHYRVGKERKMYDKFYYKDITKCQYRTATKRINIYGKVEGKWYDYNKDGSLPTEPTYHKTTDSFDYFYTIFAQGIDFVKEIEEHSPIKVTLEDI